MESLEDNATTVAALLRERESCEARGLTERVELINEQLRALGAGSQFTRRRETRPNRQPVERR